MLTAITLHGRFYQFLGWIAAAAFDVVQLGVKIPSRVNASRRRRRRSAQSQVGLSMSRGGSKRSWGKRARPH